eukprot:21124_1
MHAMHKTKSIFHRVHHGGHLTQNYRSQWRSKSTYNPFDIKHKQASGFWRSRRQNMRQMEMGDLALYVTSIWITMFGAAYASAPLYRSLCQRFGWGGAVSRDNDKKMAKLLKWRDSSEHRRKNKKLLIRFDTRTGPGMEWDFEPVQSYVITRPGESTLAFFKATNHSEHPISGLSTYTILPYKAAPYFVKIQCFCFEEQRLQGKEEVDMPVLFFVEPDFLDEPSLAEVDEITLSYIFYPVMEEDGEVEYDDYDSDPFYNDDIQKGTIPATDTNITDSQLPGFEPQLQA